MFPSLFKIAGVKHGSVRDHISEDNNCWSFHFKRILRDVEVTQLMSMLLLIGDSPPSLSNLPDSRSWTPSSSGTFSVKSTYLSLSEFPRDPSSPPFPYKSIWNNHVPPKVCFFYWTAALCKISTQDSLQHRSYSLASRCPLCKSERESTQHLLLSSQFTRTVWSLILPNHIPWNPPPSIIHLAQSWSFKDINGLAKEIWDMVPAAIIWVIWNERNNRIFEENYLSNFQISVEVKALILAWSSAFKRNFNFRLDECIFSWESMFH
ncbi:uncharacterized protein LOC113327856 [Papaver somniferum]|uniref:uncharacterized protein LOC113327856 n=1 Tax=Papaver somniferum TaxID=3469 RepID=UPI000E6FD728|nr:uncharacterized protein LOC113327856 [Papaver somniferum]